MSFWMTTKFDSECKECGLEIKKGDRIVYDPETKIVLCSDRLCGVADSGVDPQEDQANAKQAMKFAQSRSKRK